MAAMMLRVPVVAVCENCEGVYEAAYDIDLNQLADGKGRFNGELRQIRDDFSDYLGEQGWIVYGKRCFCPDCAESEGISAPMAMDAYSLLKEAGQLFRSGRPAVFSKNRGSEDSSLGYDAGSEDGDVYCDYEDSPDNGVEEQK